MNPSHDPSATPGQPPARHVALRNTYGLLACSLIPAVLGAWVGINLRITEGITGVLALLVLLLGGMGFSILLRRWRHTVAGLPLLAAFTFFAGVMLSLTLVRWLGFYTTANSLMTALVGAVAVLCAAATGSAVLRRALSPGVQAVLTIVALLLVTAVAQWLLRSSTQVILLSVLAGGLLGVAMLYQQHLLVRRAAVAGGGAPSSPAVDTLNVFLGMFGGFESLSALIGRTDSAAT